MPPLRRNDVTDLVGVVGPPGRPGGGRRRRGGCGATGRCRGCRPFSQYSRLIDLLNERSRGASQSARPPGGSLHQRTRSRRTPDPGSPRRSRRRSPACCGSSWSARRPSAAGTAVPSEASTPFTKLTRTWSTGFFGADDVVDRRGAGRAVVRAGWRSRPGGAPSGSPPPACRPAAATTGWCRRCGTRRSRCRPGTSWVWPTRKPVFGSPGIEMSGTVRMRVDAEVLRDRVRHDAALVERLREQDARAAATTGRVGRVAPRLAVGRERRVRRSASRTPRPGCRACRCRRWCRRRRSRTAGRPGSRPS